MARISIIMGIYNCANTLPEALNSIISQTYTQWKLIMCDDGSKDDTYAVAQQYVKKYPDKMLLIRNEHNMGLNFTLNYCLKYANTEYIARMDGDDISLPTRFEEEIRFLDNNPKYSIVSTPMIYFDQNGDWGTGKGNGEPTRESIAIGTPFCHAPCMVRKVAYDAVCGYTVDKKLLRMEDYHLWIKMYAKGFKGYNLSQPLYKMRDDRSAAQRRAYRFRINEARVHCIAVKTLHLSPKYYVYALRPLVLGLLPTKLYESLHKARVNRKT